MSECCMKVLLLFKAYIPTPHLTREKSKQRRVLEHKDFERVSMCLGCIFDVFYTKREKLLQYKSDWCSVCTFVCVYITHTPLACYGATPP